MQIRKTHRNIKPDLLYNEVRDFILKQGVTIGESRIETSSLPTDSSSFVSRGTLTFRAPVKSGNTGEECIRVHILGSAKTETKMMLDINEQLFPQEKVAALQADLEFILGSHEVS